jgi:DNA polymerase-3 subunit epsilon
MLPSDCLAFVDLETTGTTASRDHITEIGIVEVSSAGVTEWSSLVNPGVPIPELISALTGITDAMVADAPRFAELATGLQERLAGRLFIAHNARFDHGFLKNEFRRLGMEFRPTVLCTVKLSRRLFPGFGHHNLDALIQRHRLSVTERHRALGDARLIRQFWQVLHETLEPKQIQAVVQELTARPSLPQHLDAHLVDELPNRHGVYFFYGENSLPLYVGKANDLRRRVLAHFSSDHRSDPEMELAQQVRRIDWIETSGEIGALLQEATFIKRMVPLYNQQLRRSQELCAWRILERDTTWSLSLAEGNDLFFDQDENLYGLYANAKKAADALRHIADQNGLCPVVLGLEKGRAGKPCFAYQVKRCQGACTGQEPMTLHQQRLRTALAPLRLQVWPYPGPIGIREGNALHVVHGWSYLGCAQSEDAVMDLLAHGKALFDRDVYRILQPRLARLGARVVPLGSFC